MLTLNPRRTNDLELLYYVSKESLGKTVLEDYHTQKQTLNKFTIGQIILTEPVIDAIRKTIKKMSSEIKVSNEDILNILPDVLKREVLEGEKSEEAKKKLLKAFKMLIKKEAKELPRIQEKVPA